MEHEDVYRALARRLDEIPNGYPATESGVELRILAWLFRPEEAALAAQMRLTPETAEEIALRTGQEPAAVHALLKGMAKRGLIRAQRGQGELAFALMPFVVGIYEMQGNRIDAEFARLVEQYFEEAFHQVVTTQPALHRVIPVEEAVPVGIEILPYERASEILNQAAAWGVTECLCRKQQRLVGKGCDKPQDLCMAFSRTPGAFDHSTSVRALTRQEAAAELRRAQEAGLIASTSNTQGDIWYICNCCTCCCGIMRFVAERGLAHSVAHSGFWAVIDAGLCTGCESCLERCGFGALSLQGAVMQVDHERCAGCGLCVTTCPSEALRLERRPEAVPIPPDMGAWLEERAKKRGVDLGRVL